MINVKIIYKIILGVLFFCSIYLVIGYQIYSSKLPPDQFDNCSLVEARVFTYSNEFLINLSDNTTKLAEGKRQVVSRIYQCSDGLRFG